MMKEFTYLQDELDTMKQQGTHQTLKEIDSKQSSTVTLNEQSVIQLSSNNYLGLTSHPRLMKAAKEAIDEFGAGTGSVRTIAGTMTMHERRKSSQLLKDRGSPRIPIRLYDQPRVLSSILTKDDIVISDELNHASIIDGIRLTKADKKYMLILIWKSLRKF